jgi:hypothetical protein
MPSLKLSAAVLATALFSMTVSQITYEIDPNSVPLATRQQWCTSQETACPLLCLQLPGSSSTTSANDCDPVSFVITHLLLSSNTPSRPILHTIVFAATAKAPMLQNIPKHSHISSALHTAINAWQHVTETPHARALAETTTRAVPRTRPELIPPRRARWPQQHFLLEPRVEQLAWSTLGLEAVM